jgi:hypothetical protein
MSSSIAASSGVARADPPAPAPAAATPVAATTPVAAKRAEQPTLVATRDVRVGPVADAGATTPAAKAPDRVVTDKAADRRRWMIVGGASATALGIVMGTAFTILSEDQRAERDRQIVATHGCQGLACEPYNAPERARGAFLTGALVSFLAAGAVGAGTLTYALVTRPKKSAPHAATATATVSAGPGGAAARVGINW